MSYEEKVSNESRAVFDVFSSTCVKLFKLIFCHFDYKNSQNTEGPPSDKTKHFISNFKQINTLFFTKNLQQMQRNFDAHYSRQKQRSQAHPPLIFQSKTLNQRLLG
jgi:hypothetical protein